MINDFDETKELEASQASRNRSGVGILLYLSHDLIECQFVIRALARFMSKPTERGWDILKYLVQYLLGRIEYGLLRKIEENNHADEVDLHVFSDSDWAGHKGSRKSASSCFVKVDGALLHSSSHTQGIIAVLSREAECYASVSSQQMFELLQWIGCENQATLGQLISQADTCTLPCWQDQALERESVVVTTES